MTTQTAVAIKGGAMVASGGMVADLIIFNDPAYIQLSIVGAVVSASGVIHQISIKKDIGIFNSITEVMKGIIIGLLAIPFWYLMLSDIGNSITKNIFEIDDTTKISKSVWLIISFGMSWYTVPIFNWIVKSVVSIMSFVLNRFISGIK